MSIVDNFQQIQSQLPQKVQLVAVSKFQPMSSIQILYDQHQRIFGESKVQELLSKYEALPKDINWHFIGHLQTNKVKEIVPFISLIHGVDSFKLLSEIDKCAAKINRVVNCLLQVHIAQEETKFGFSFDELDEMLKSKGWKELRHIRICGLMGMASFTNDDNQVRKEFRSLSNCFSTIKKNYFSQISYFSEISMGMSGDYPIAIEEGATLVRIGSSIFGERVY
jgi:pyridoxal phosphate enzyme (YggS family)